jgi:uncharacterized protein (TIGR02271 family)
MGFQVTRSTFIPWKAVSSTDDEGRAITVATDKDKAKGGPTSDDDKEITPEFENEVHSYYGLEGTRASEDRGRYGAHFGHSEGEHPGEVRHGTRMGDTETGEVRGHSNDQEGLRQAESDVEDELRVPRSEQELRAGTREREAGAVNMRKRVRPDRERLEVPTGREKVTVDRVPMEAEAAEAEIGDDEVSVSVTEVKVVVEKRPVAKEEIRIRKDVVEDTVVVEEDVRREEIDVEDETVQRNR